MQYIVMECHTSYAIVLDETGKFLKAANMHYEVGQTVTEIVQMQEPETQSKPKKNLKWVYTLATIAACLVLAFTSLFTIRQTPYASVYMTINPEVRIDINRKDIVIGLEGMNADGIQLVTDYSYKEKNLNLVMDELVDRAIEMGYLSSGGQITLKLDAEDDEWVIVTGNTLGDHLNEYLTEKVSVTIQVNETITTGQEIVIPTNPDVNTPDPPTGSSDYGDSNYGEVDDDGTSDYGVSDYGDSDDGDSDYGDTDDGASGYGDTDDDGDSNYDVTDDDGASDYGDTDDSDSGYDDTDDGDDSNYGDTDDSGDSGYDDTDDGGDSNYGNTGDNGTSDYGDTDDDGDSDYSEPVPPAPPVSNEPDDSGSTDYDDSGSSDYEGSDYDDD